MVQMLTGWSADWVRAVAKRDQWRTFGKRPKLYALADVLDSAAGHKANAVERHLHSKWNQTARRTRHAELRANGPYGP